jgi:type I restriction enzyme S subunit
MSTDWPMVPLRDVLTERQETPSDYAIASGQISIVAKIGFNDGKIQLRNDGQTKTKMILIRPGDLVISGINAAKGAVSIYGEENANPIAATIHYSSYLPNKDKTDIRYLWWLLRSEKFRDLLLEYVPGGIKTELKAKRFLPVPIPLPPLDEQRRIVTRIEELASKIEEAQKLRRQVAEELEALFPAYLGNIFKSLAIQYGTKKLGDLSSQVTDGPHKTPNYVLDGIPFVTVKNMVTGKLDFNDVNYILPEDHVEFSKRCKPEKGDVLYSKDGATRGNPCLVDNDIEFNIFVSVALIKPIRDMLNGKYLCYVLMSRWIKDQMLDKSRGDMIPHIVLGEIKNFPIPQLPVDEQHRIVAHLDELQAKVNALKKYQARTGEGLDALLPSVLDKAFKGEL